MSSSERAEAAELKNMDDKVLELVVRIGQLKKKAENQSKHFEMFDRTEKQKELVFSGKQEEAITTSLRKMYVKINGRSDIKVHVHFSFWNISKNICYRGKDISELISQVKVLEEDLDVWRS